MDGMDTRLSFHNTRLTRQAETWKLEWGSQDVAPAPSTSSRLKDTFGGHGRRNWRKLCEREYVLIFLEEAITHFLYSSRGADELVA